ncbi:LysR family transcriptional regulator [uncultured Exiguobacterium sp.]|uniref:LysR family transcriptional regulator n=1 Tax=uncultured Exiguobacterium sp. TaxID=202669 RepID=UPI0026005176|nr:LysR family transcriptional regulator [uncultured Exiguobacterium sp.]
MMELQQLRYFLALVEEKNITKAARILRLSQPALSRQLQQLEETIGVELFERSKQGLRLTEKGRFFEERAREMVTLADKVLVDLNTKEVLTGEIHIGGGETQQLTTVLQAFRDLHAIHPDVTIRMYSGNGNDVLERLEKGLLDFGLVIAPFDVSAFHSLQLPGQDQWGILTRRDASIAQSNTISREQLISLPLLVSEQTQLNMYFREQSGLTLEDCPIIGTYNLLFNASLLVRQGVGHALAIDGIIDTTASDLTFLPLDPPVVSDVHLIWKKEATLSPSARVLLRTIKEGFHL